MPSKTAKLDPKEDPDFKRVVKHFLATPAKPHAPAKVRAKKRKQKSP